MPRSAPLTRSFTEAARSCFTLSPGAQSPGPSFPFLPPRNRLIGLPVVPAVASTSRRAKKSGFMLLQPKTPGDAGSLVAPLCQRRPRVPFGRFARPDAQIPAPLFCKGMPTALCMPNGFAWATATQAGVRPVETLFSDRILPVEHRAPGTYAVKRLDYALGLLLIATAHDPYGAPVVLPAVVTAASEVSLTLDPSNLLDLPGGGLVIFV